VFKADGKEGVYIAELDVDMLRTYRETEVHGNAYRRPQKYSILTENKIQKPFIRENYRS
jgi:hypothetical protein